MSYAQELARLNAACVSTFGLAAVLEKPSGGTFALVGIAEDPADLNVAVHAQTFNFFVEAAAIVAAGTIPEAGDEVTLAGKVYKITAVRSDEGGGQFLILDYTRDV